VFTLPLVAYHFHQLPVLFLFSNLIAVPLSGIILFGELLLFCFSYWPAAASLLGIATEFSIKAMNSFIKHINKLPLAVWDALHISMVQLLLSLVVTCFFAAWIFYKSTRVFLGGLCILLVFFIVRDVDIIHHRQQQKLVVYNVSKRSAIDFIDGSTRRFAGDSTVLTDVSQRNFNLRPAQIKDRIYSSANNMLPNIENYILTAGNAKILLLGKPVFISKPVNKIPLNLLILTGKADHDPRSISNLFECNIIVADATIPEWKAIKLKKEFEQLHLRFYSVAQQGAFTLKL
jgi:competence protein ComEC